MQTRPIDAIRLWWRDIHFTRNQRIALGTVALSALLFSGFLILRPSASAAPAEISTPTIVAPPLLYVDVEGEIKLPGVYTLPPSSRVIDAIKAAGGAKPNADLSLINLARVLKDGEQIYLEKRYVVSSKAKSSKISVQRGPLNINRATISELDKLPGIGPVIASRIIEYRKVNGPFMSIEDLKKVKGLGGSKFEKLREKVRV